MNADDTIRVFLLDDYEIVRRGLKELLETEGNWPAGERSLLLRVTPSQVTGRRLIPV
jgi:DNA-binding NarL/FixJ family response regulator